MARAALRMSLPRASIRRIARRWDRRRCHALSGGGDGTADAAAAPEPLVRWELDAATRIGTLTLNAPGTLNALTVEMGRDFERLCRRLERDLTTGGAECHAIVLTGAGDQAVRAEDGPRRDRNTTFADT